MSKNHTNKDLAIVIPVWNNWSFTKRAISDLSHLPENHLTIIVDNGSTDQTKLLKSSDQFIVIRNDANLGFAAACNRGYEKAKELGYSNVMFLNNDIKVDSSLDSWTDQIIEIANSGFIVGPTIGCLDERFNFICESVKWPSAGFSYMSGWNITASVNTWEKIRNEVEIGPFSTKFFAYFEDTDLSFRAKDAGIEFQIVKIPVRHFGRATGKKLGLSSVYLESKNIFNSLWSHKL